MGLVFLEDAVQTGANSAWPKGEVRLLTEDRGHQSSQQHPLSKQLRGSLAGCETALIKHLCFCVT